jgi:signal transduction histidine kinase
MTDGVADEPPGAEIERLEARVAQLERERAEIDAYVAMAAHEMLRPLIMTEAVAELILGRSAERLDFESADDLRRLVTGSARVRHLVESLLLAARQDGRPLEHRTVDVQALVDECVHMLRPEIAERGAHVEIAPLPVVEGDAALLGGVFSNLLNNALKYGPRLGGDIRVSAVRGEAGWTFEVASRGPAIPEPERQRIFDPWRRGRDERRALGSGLGLAIVRRIVERHGGEVGVRSPDGGGNFFFFTLPT